MRFESYVLIYVRLLLCAWTANSTKTLVGIHIQAENFNPTVFSKTLIGLSGAIKEQPNSVIFTCITNYNGIITNTNIHETLVRLEVPHFYAASHALNRFCALEHPDFAEFDYLLQVDFAIDTASVNISKLSVPTISDTYDIIYLHSRQASLMTAYIESGNDISASSIDAVLSSNATFSYSPSTDSTKSCNSETKNLPPRGAAQKFHSSGPCNLWWPLHGSEIFIPSTNMLEHTEPVIMICPNYSQFLESSSLISVGRRRQLKRVLQVEYFISQSGHAFSTGTQATKIQLLDVEGVDFEEAVQVMVPIKLAANTSHVRLRVSMCTVQSKVSYVDPSSCYVSFDVVVKVVYGDQVPLTKSAAPWHPMMATMGSRDVFGYALKMMGHNTGTFVEVGVNRGRFAKLMLTQWDGNRYLMVDPWTPAPSEEYVDIANAASAEVHNEVLKEAIRNVLPFGKRPVVIRDTSVGAATWMVNASVDVVYIDGLHHYAGVMDDIEAWWPKLKRGGVMAGHDYYLMSESKTIFTVKPAVDEFMRKMGLVVFQTQDSYPTWFVMKE